MFAIPRTFLGRLLVLALLALAPFLGLELLHLGRMKSSVLTQHAEQATTLARAAVMRHRSMLQAAELAMQQIAAMSRVRFGDPATCQARIADIRASTPLFVDIARGSVDGLVDCSADPDRRTFNPVTLTVAKRAVETGKPALGVATIGSRSGKPFVPYGVPLLEPNAGVNRALVGAVSLEWLDRLLEDLGIGTEAVVMVLDDRDTVLATAPLRPALLGKVLADIESPLDAKNGRAFGPMPDDRRQTLVVTDFKDGIRVAVGVDHRPILAEIDRQQARHFAIFAAVAIASLLLFGLSAQFAFQRRHNRFREAAERIAKGDLASRLEAQADDSREFQQFAKVFNAMAEAIAERDEALRRQSHLLTEAEGLAGMGSWAWEAGRKEHIWSDGIWRILGRRPNSLPSTWSNWLCCIHPDDVDQVARLGEAIEPGRGYENEYRVLRPDSSIRHVQARGICRTDPTGTVLGTLGIVVDVTERKRIEDQLRTLSRVLEQTQEMVIVVNTQEVVEYVNPAFERLTGYSAAEAIGRGPALTRSKATPSGTYRRIHADLMQGRSWVEEMQIRRKDGGETWMESAFHPIRDPAGQITHFVSLHRDIGARKEAERLLRDARTRAEAGHKAMSEFLAHMSHELRTPLNAIIGYSEAMLSGLLGEVANAKHREYTQDIFDSGHHLLELISDILDISAIEAGMLTLAPETIELASLVESVLRLVRPRALKGKVALTARLPQPAPRLFADPRRLKQILANLLSNAVKFSPPETEVALTVTLGRERRCCLTVEDQGIGMDTEGIAKALVPFGRVAGTEHYYEGTGLGLPLTKSLIELHGGKMTIDSAKGQGTRVTVCFPPERVIKPD
ncbi:MAG: PAS domain S-box protein [Rhodospirillales bacterium]|nr:PAS domain S-box protein [Rhodospirillales bacterium]